MDYGSKKVNVIIFVEENLRENLQDPELGKECSNLIPKAESIKGKKVNKLDLIKIFKFPQQKTL